MKHNNDIAIKRFSDTTFTTEDVHRLVDEAWQRWFDAGLDSVWFHSSEEQFSRTIKSRVVFVALAVEHGYTHIQESTATTLDFGDASPNLMNMIDGPHQSSAKKL